MASDVFLSARVLGAASLNSALGRTRFAIVAITHTFNLLSARASFFRGSDTHMGRVSLVKVLPDHLQPPHHSHQLSEPHPRLFEVMGPGNSFPGANLLTKTFTYFVDLQLIWNLPLCDSAVSNDTKGKRT